LHPLFAALHDLLCEADFLVFITEHIILLFLGFEYLIYQALIGPVASRHVHKHTKNLVAKGLWVVAVAHRLQIVS
jgi:hypothetical protein